MNKQLVGAIAVGVVLLGGGVYFAASSDEEPAAVTKTAADVMEPAGDDPVEPATDAGGGDAAPAAGGTFVSAKGNELDGIKGDKRVLFFHASWCSTCKRLTGDIEANAADIPAGLTIVKVDFDEETALKQKYGVTTQHTLVQVDAEGNEIAKWSGSPSLESLVGELA